MSPGRNWLVWKEIWKGIEKAQKSKALEGWKHFTLLDFKTVKDKTECFEYLRPIKNQP